MKNRPFLATRSALALAALAALSAAPGAVHALGVGRLNVQSALGEGMRAEIDITSLTPDEAASLAVRVASPDAYRAAGVDYNAVLSGTQATVVRRADGRATLRLNSDRAVQEPFIEVILELTWASGRLVREFTLLFDPPGSRNAPPSQAAAPVSPVLGAAPMAQATGVDNPVIAARPLPPARPNRQPAPPQQQQVAAAPPDAAAPVKTSPPPPKAAPRAAVAPAERPAPVARPAGGKQYAVRSGDTLYRVAGRNSAGGVSLDQMLVGLYRANPDAFIGGNVNRLRAGAVLSVPSADEVSDVSQADMRRLITAQSVDFGAYRNRLAQSAPMAQAQEPGRQAQGKVQAAVEDRKQSAALSPDKLKLSGAAASSAAAPAAADPKGDVARVAELSRNVEALKKLQQGAAAAQASAAVVAPPPAVVTPSAAPPVAAAAASAAVLPPLPVVAAAASVAVPPVAPVVAAAPPPPAPAPKPAVAPVVAASPETSSASLLENLGSNLWLLSGAGLLALLAAGYGAWRLRGRMRKTASETSFLESRMQPDSFFGASGGQHVDTHDGTRTNASAMGYSLSQLDAIGDVDPVAEADVYLAYGRDLQAEEILKEAMRTTPDRLAVRTKLLEVYAKRRDTKGFELLATQLYSLTKGVGPDWARAQELGRQCDPNHQLYQPGGHPEEIILDGERVVIELLGATTQPHSVQSAPTQAFEDSGLPPLRGYMLDLDLNLDEPDDGAAQRAMEATRPFASSAQRAADPGLDFDTEVRTQPVRRAPPDARSVVTAERHHETLNMDLDTGFDSDITQSLAQKSPPERSGDATTIDFGQFPATGSGDFSDAPITSPGEMDDLSRDSGNPLSRKLELADEFRQIGDIDGARDLLEEVLGKASGTLRSKAQAMLDALN